MKTISILVMCVIGLLLASSSFAANNNEFTDGIAGETGSAAVLFDTVWSGRFADTEALACDGRGQGKARGNRDGDGKGEPRRDGVRRGNGSQDGEGRGEAKRDGNRRGGGKRDGTGREDGTRKGDCEK